MTWVRFFRGRRLFVLELLALLGLLAAIALISRGTSSAETKN
jgi:hypothetical protein